MDQNEQNRKHQEQMLAQQRIHAQQKLMADQSVAWYQQEIARYEQGGLPKAVMAVDGRKPEVIYHPQVARLIDHIRMDLAYYMIENYPVLVCTDPLEYGEMFDPWNDALAKPAPKGFFWVTTDDDKFLTATHYGDNDWQDDFGHKVMVTHYMPIPRGPVKVLRKERKY